ncbi:MAG: hypothetical protein KDC18_04940 [Alphaproteobacteria bacterium]|nr:hypothetical protein [Alphaproteobacteria bacterium]MCB9928729.1 hypothetical protein [Alphaproteobacteria bacterium]
MMDGSVAERPLLDSRVAAFLVFSVGLLLAILAGLLGENADYMRAKATIWPAAALGGWAVALMIRHGFGQALAATAWRSWWAWGLLAYAIHLWWGFGVIYGGDLDAVYAGQGTLVASANFALLALWAASVIAAFAGAPAAWLHGVTALLFGVSILAASILFGRDVSPIGGIVLVLIWLGALYLRPSEKE